MPDRPTCLHCKRPAIVNLTQTYFKERQPMPLCKVHAYEAVRKADRVAKAVLGQEVA